MSQHLPECDTFRFAYGDGYGGCICEWLRACEKRVREETTRSLTPFLISRKDDLIRINYRSGYHTALLDAREALEHLLHEDPCDCDACRTLTTVQAALAAIDALRGES